MDIFNKKKFTNQILQYGSESIGFFFSLMRFLSFQICIERWKVDKISLNKTNNFNVSKAYSVMKTSQTKNIVLKVILKSFSFSLEIHLCSVFWYLSFKILVVHNTVMLRECNLFAAVTPKHYSLCNSACVCYC